MSLLLDALKQAEKSKEASSETLDIEIDASLDTEEPRVDEDIVPPSINSGVKEALELNVEPVADTPNIEDESDQIKIESVNETPSATTAETKNTDRIAQPMRNQTLDVFAVGSQAKKMSMSQTSTRVLLGFFIILVLVVGWLYWPTLDNSHQSFDVSAEITQPLIDEGAAEAEVVQSPVVEKVSISEQPSDTVELINNTITDVSNILTDKEQVPIKKTVEHNAGISITKRKTSRRALRQLNSAYNALQREDLVTAEQIYRNVLKIYPKQIDATLGLANIAARKGLLNNARTLYEDVLKQDESNKTAQLGVLYTYQNQNNDALLTTLKDMNNKFEDQPEVMASLGHQLAKEMKWHNAQKYYFKAFELDSLNPVYAYNLAVSLDQMGKYQPAITFYKRTLELLNSSNSSLDQTEIRRRIQQLGE